MSELTNEKVVYDPPVTLKVGQIQFAAACLPPLVAGEYRIRIKQRILDSAAPDAAPWHAEPYQAGLDFSVEAPRFNLNPSDIHAVYPPANQTGRFDNAFPHVVFTRRTLPWERTVDGKAPTSQQSFAPWMALILLKDDELIALDSAGKPTHQRHELKSLPVLRVEGENDCLLFPANANIRAPDLQQSNREKWNREQALYAKERCLAIDLPAELFHAVAPREGDLPYLAHVRQVDTGNKEVFAINDKGWFSVVVGNRLPQAGQQHRAFLVSLEGHQARLRDDWIPEPGTRIRLVVLGTWVFNCEGTNDFKGMMNNLTVGPLNLPFQPYADDSLEPEDIVNGAYSRGYTAFDHTFRHGEQTVSWYRGPCVPVIYNQPKQVQEVATCADELLRYDPDTGMMDVTYAAAWQLGRLLALQNQSFALALQRVRQQMKSASERRLRMQELEQLRKKRGLSPDAGRFEDEILQNMAYGFSDDWFEVSGD
ncbi:MAG: hypothetical protein BVN35_08135 [Proteobacteria bacterium ST_bin11]|nr:MAG: hypothetical protein BVN35_08135 [Proteobacteria bacterium ST_bin11]